MKTSPLLFALILSLFSGAAFGLPASKSNSGRIVERADELEGSWVSTDLSGDAIWLVVQQVGVNFKKDETFTVTAVLDGGGRKSFSGPYHVDIGKVRLTPEGLGPQVCTYSVKDGVLTLYNAKHGITGTFKQGTLPAPQQQQSGGGGMPGMHF